MAARVLRPACGSSRLSQLTDLDRPARHEFLSSMDLLAEAVGKACQDVMTGFRRINLDILGNTDDFLHAHVWPRYDWEPPDRISAPVWLYPAEFWSTPTLQLGVQHGPLREAIGSQLDALTQSST